MVLVTGLCLPFQYLQSLVTEELRAPRDPQTGFTAKHVIKVQPLKKDEMQPSYAQDMGVGGVTHGFYGSMMQSLGSCIGFCGAIPCCPLPNPFKQVRQGQFFCSVPTSSNSFFLYWLRGHRVCGTGLTLRPVLQSSRSRFGPGQCLHRVPSRCRRQDPNHFHRSANCHHS